MTMTKCETCSETYNENEEHTCPQQVTETPAEKFKRVANPRFAKAIKAIQVLTNCASPEYEYTKEQVETIVTVLSEELDNLASAYAGRPVQKSVPKL